MLNVSELRVRLSSDQRHIPLFLDPSLRRIASVWVSKGPWFI